MFFHFVVFAHVQCCTCPVHRAMIQPSFVWLVKCFLYSTLRIVLLEASESTTFEKLWKTACRCFSVLFESLPSAVAAVGRWRGWGVKRVLIFCSLPERVIQQNQRHIHIFAFSFPIFYFPLKALLGLIKSCCLKSWLILSVRKIKTIKSANIPSVYFIIL